MYQGHVSKEIRKMMLGLAKSLFWKYGKSDEKVETEIMLPDVPALQRALSVFLSTPCPLHYPLLAASQGHFPLAGNGPARTKWTRAI